MIKDKKKNDDLFFNEPSSNEDPQIVDNHNMIKLITQNLKKKKKQRVYGILLLQNYIL